MSPARATPPAQVVSIGRSVHYQLSDHDINRIRHRISRQTRMDLQGCIHHLGDVVPLIVTAVNVDEEPAMVNGQAFLDGNEVLWVTAAPEGDGPGTWSWPKRT